MLFLKRGNSMVILHKEKNFFPAANFDFVSDKKIKKFIIISRYNAGHRPEQTVRVSTLLSVNNEESCVLQWEEKNYYLYSLGTGSSVC